MQLSILSFFQKISNPVLDKLVEFITMFGEESFFILAIVLILWCIDKKRGFAIFSSLFCALVGMGILKAILKVPRPFQVSDKISGKRISTATGYSFPSGHSTGAGSFYSALALSYKKQVISIIGAVLIAIVGLSRLYLGVHWPLDVFGGIVLGITVSFALYTFFENYYEKYPIWPIGAVATVAAFVLSFLISKKSIDIVGFTDLTKLLALAGGGYLGFALEQKYINYVIEGSLVKKGIRFIIGFVVLLAIQASKKVFGPSMLVTFLRYWGIGLWVTFIYPVIGSKIKSKKGVPLFSIN
ncbi:MAG: phosphatase PAP2 family protein [Sphaerochaetaceae bacterium]